MNIDDLLQEESSLPDDFFDDLWGEIDKEPSEIPLDYDAAERFLNMLDPDAKKFTFQIFADDKGCNIRPEIRHGSLSNLWSWIKESQGRGAGVFVTINETDFLGRKKENITRIRTVVIDDDGKMEEPKTLPIKPSMVVETSENKYHKYFLLSDSDMTHDAFSSTQQGLVKYGNDPAVRDVTRVLRLPGTLHLKNRDQPWPVRIVTTSKEKYSTREILVEFQEDAGCKTDFDNATLGNGIDIADLISQVVSMESIHPSLLRLAAHYTGAGTSENSTIRSLEAIMLQVPESKRDKRWRDRYKQIESLVASAVKKFGNVALEANKGVLQLVCGADVTPESIDWIWPGYLAAGKLHIMAGAPGCGKTTICLSLAATISAGGTFPDNTRARTGRVIVWSGEDGVADTLVPRLKAMGADMKNIFFVKDIIEDGETVSFDPAYHLPQLAKAIDDIGGVDLIVVDPVINAVTGDSHKNAEVRRGLAPLVDLGERHGAAIVGVTHFSKGTRGQSVTERVTGSIAFGALARVVFAVAKTEGEERIFTRGKSNIGPDNGGFYYRIENVNLFETDVSASVIEWGAAAEGDTVKLLNDAEGGDDKRNVAQEAIDWLRSLLGDGEHIERGEIIKRGREQGFTEVTLKRAKKQGGIEHRIGGFGKSRRSVWYIPQLSSEEPEDLLISNQFNPVSISSETDTHPADLIGERPCVSC